MLASLYDLANGWSLDRDFYRSLVCQPSMDVLDLGCGTGLLCNAYAEDGHRMVGVDPAEVMLHQAYKKKYASLVEWVNCDCRHFQHNRQFDLIVMTGHAFQVLLHRSDVLLLFNMVARQLKPSGRFVFESRNPAHDWQKDWHGRRLSYPSPYGQVTESITVEYATLETIKFITHYLAGGQSFQSASILRFFNEKSIRSLAQSSTLKVSDIFGDWNKSLLNESSKEMIFVMQK